MLCMRIPNTYTYMLSWQINQQQEAKAMSLCLTSHPSPSAVGSKGGNDAKLPTACELALTLCSDPLAAARTHWC